MNPTLLTLIAAAIAAYAFKDKLGLGGDGVTSAVGKSDAPTGPDYAKAVTTATVWTSTTRGRSAIQSSSPHQPWARASAVVAACSHTGAEPMRTPSGVHQHAARCPRRSANGPRSIAAHASPAAWWPSRVRAMAATVASSGRTHVGSLAGIKMMQAPVHYATAKAALLFSKSTPVTKKSTPILTLITWLAEP